jgi:hypothetical protein
VRDGRCTQVQALPAISDEFYFLILYEKNQGRRAARQAGPGCFHTQLVPFV